METNDVKETPRTILIVEDDEDMNALMAEVLNLKGYRTLSATSGIEALEIAGKQRPDMILLDVMIKCGDGISVLKKLSEDERTKSTPVIMVTVRSDLQTKLSAYIFGAKRYITKPFGIDELTEEVEKTFKQNDLSKYLSENTEDGAERTDFGVFPMTATN